MVETNLCPGFGFESKEQLLRQVLTYLNLPNAPSCEPSARIARLGGDAQQMDKIPKLSIITD